MKKVIMLAAVVAALASCQSKANKAAEAEAQEQIFHFRLLRMLRIISNKMYIRL